MGAHTGCAAVHTLARRHAHTQPAAAAPGGGGALPSSAVAQEALQKPEPAASLRSCPCRLAWAPLPPPEAALAPPPPAAAGPAVLVVVLFGLLLS